MANPRQLLAQQDVVDNLTSTSTIFPLSANQGRVLQEEINSISGSFLFGAETIKSSDGTLFTFPSTIANDLSIIWDSTNTQPGIFNNSTDNINYSLVANWDRINEQGYPDRRAQPTTQQNGIGTIYFTDTNSPVSGLILDDNADNLSVYIQFYNLTTLVKANIKFDIMIDATIDLSTQYVKILGFYEEL
jgi:hypothetical protein